MTEPWRWVRVAALSAAWALAACGETTSPPADTAAALDTAALPDSAEPPEDTMASPDADAPDPDAADAPDPDAADAPGPDAADPDADAADAADPDAADASPADAADAADAAPACPGAWPARVLFVGNSYTAANDLPAAVRALAASHPCAPAAALVTAMHAPGGTTLAQHGADAQNPAKPLYALLRDPAGWDAVVLHDQSQVPGFTDGDPSKAASVAALPGLASLAHAAGARVVLLMTWGRRDGDALNPGLFPDYPTMQARLAAGYASYAAAASAALGEPVPVAPAGLAWSAVRDGVGSASPAEAASRFASLYQADGSHPAPRGTYLAAAALLPALFGVPAREATAHPGVDAADKAWLDLAADEAWAP